MAIDRKQTVTRHNPIVTVPDAWSRLSVGNGEFAFTTDATGLQTFLTDAGDGIPLCTQSQWGWHTTPPGEPEAWGDRSALRQRVHRVGDREVSMPTDVAGQAPLFNWLRENPHRLHLGRIGLCVGAEDDAAFSEDQMSGPWQQLDLWSGLLHSRFLLHGIPVETQVCCHPSLDQLAVRISSELLREGRMSVMFNFPYGSQDKTAADWSKDFSHETTMKSVSADTTMLYRQMDDTRYVVDIRHGLDAIVRQAGRNRVMLLPGPAQTEMTFCVRFSPVLSQEGEDHGRRCPDFLETVEAGRAFWEQFWQESGFVRLADSRDPRALELERRIILSRYLTAIQCAGSRPPQETGLTFNSWYGKYHLEMHPWHALHFPLWGQGAMLARSMDCYRELLPTARNRAAEQGLEGARWPKMTDATGADSPSHIGPLLIWQQPHPIYLAELLYREARDPAVLERYCDIVFESARCMASFARWNPDTGCYDLGPGLIPAQENHAPEATLNPSFELAYWSFGLRVANQWRERLGLQTEARWADVGENMAPLPVQGDLCLAHEHCPDTFTTFADDHPSMLCAMGYLPGQGADAAIMATTLAEVLRVWRFDTAWGWDFPVMAMTAARLGLPEVAIDTLLMDSPKNTYLVSGHNRQGTEGKLPVYLPGNGGVLLAVALMVAGWDGCDRLTPGFPDNGDWQVQWEGLSPLP